MLKPSSKVILHLAADMFKQSQHKLSDDNQRLHVVNAYDDKEHFINEIVRPFSSHLVIITALTLYGRAAHSVSMLDMHVVIMTFGRAGNNTLLRTSANGACRCLMNGGGRVTTTWVWPAQSIRG